MANTFELIASSTVGSGGASSIDFTSIPSTYTDLYLVFSLRTTTTKTDGWDDTQLKINGSSASITGKQLYGTGAATGSNSPTAGGVFADHASMTSNSFSSASLYFPNYAGSAYKSFTVDSVTEQNATSALADFYAGLWSSTSAITSIGLDAISSTFVQYSTAYLYGVKNA
jgi:hypothetical protein